jgi:hypothetical protein
LGAEPLITSAENLLSKVKGVSFHAREHNAMLPYMQSRTALGIRERVAMEVTGHKTRSVFDRYDIVNKADHQEVAKKLTGIVLGIVADMPANA